MNLLEQNVGRVGKRGTGGVGGGEGGRIEEKQEKKIEGRRRFPGRGRQARRREDGGQVWRSHLELLKQAELQDR